MISKLDLFLSPTTLRTQPEPRDGLAEVLMLIDEALCPWARVQRARCSWVGVHLTPWLMKQSVKYLDYVNLAWFPWVGGESHNFSSIGNETLIKCVVCVLVFCKGIGQHSSYALRSGIIKGLVKDFFSTQLVSSGVYKIGSWIWCLLTPPKATEWIWPSLA